jgi:3-methyladenine DNA glycosylase Mpg
VRGTECRRFGRGRSHGDIVEATAGSGGNDAPSHDQHGKFTGRNDR